MPPVRRQRVTREQVNRALEQAAGMRAEELQGMLPEHGYADMRRNAARMLSERAARGELGANEAAALEAMRAEQAEREAAGERAEAAEEGEARAAHGASMGEGMGAGVPSGGRGKALIVAVGGIVAIFALMKVLRVV